MNADVPQPSATQERIDTMRAFGATVTLTPPQDEAVIRNNPIGLYLKDFDWTAQL